MVKRFLFFFLLIAAGLWRLSAQDVPVQVLDGPVLEVDSVRTRPPLDPVPPLPSVGARIQLPSLLDPLPVFETKEQRAARLSSLAASRVSASMEESLKWYRPPHYSAWQKAVFFVMSLFLSGQYDYPEGYVPLMNHSFPFIYAKTPGMAPWDNPYSPDRIPQTVQTEYDFATGTYKQVPLDWKEYQKKLSRSLQGSLNTSPVPRVSLTPGDRIAH